LTSDERDAGNKHELRTFSVSRPNGCSVYGTSLFSQSDFLQLESSVKAEEKPKSVNLSFLQSDELTGIQKKEVTKLVRTFGQAPDF
jgi:hypothetical protein